MILENLGKDYQLWIIYFGLILIAFWGIKVVLKLKLEQRKLKNTEQEHQKKLQELEQEHNAKIAQIIKNNEKRVSEILDEKNTDSAVFSESLESLKQENRDLKEELDYIRNEIISNSSAGLFGKKNFNLSDIAMKLLIENYNLRTQLKDRGWQEIKDVLNNSIVKKIDDQIKRSEENSKVHGHIYYALMENKAVQEIIMQEMNKGKLVEKEPQYHLEATELPAEKEVE